MRYHKDAETSGRIFFKHWHIEYHFWSTHCHIYFERGGYGDNYVFSFAIPPIAIWLCWGITYKENREISLKIHNGCLWWNFWTDSNEWNSKTPKWRRECFHIDDFFLGKPKYSREIIEERDVEIPMPEGCYKAHIKLCEDTWTRRWTKKIIKRIDADIPNGIPHEGKGENSWDCGIDGCFGMCAPAKSIAEGVGIIVGSVLHDRIKYGGWNDWKWNKTQLPIPKENTENPTQAK